MKKEVLISLIIFSTLNLFGQMKKGDFLILLDGNYMKTNNENGVTTNLSGSKEQYLKVGSSVGYLFTDHFVAGIGVDYHWSEETRFNKLYFNNFLQVEELKVKSKILLPNLYLGYYCQIINNLFFYANIKLGYGKATSDMNTNYAGRGNYFPSDSIDFVEGNTNGYNNGFSNKSEYAYFNSSIYPELTYFISKKVGLNLSFGSIEYSMLDWKSDNSSWVVTFNPTYWKVGLKVKL